MPPGPRRNRGTSPPGTGGLAAPLTAIALQVWVGAAPAGAAALPEVTSQSTGGRAVVSPGGVAAERVARVVWRDGLEFVRIEAAEPGAASHPGQPLRVAAGALRATLARLETTAPDGSSAPLLSPAQLDRVAAPLAEALGRAGTDQEVTLAIVGERGPAGLFGDRGVTTARVFHDGDRLHLIAGLVNAPFENRLRATGYLRPFTPGTRQEMLSQGTALTAGTGTRRPRPGRIDWVALEMAQGPPPPAMPAPAPPPAPAGPEPPPRRAPADPAPRPAAEAPARTIEHRLETLQRLHHRGLITDGEYRDKRRAILDEL